MKIFVPPFLIKQKTFRSTGVFDEEAAVIDKGQKIGTLGEE